MSKTIIGNTELISIFGILGVLSTSIFFSYSSLPPWSMYIAIPSIVVMCLIFLWISPFPERIKKLNDTKSRNNLAKKFFGEFDKKHFVDSLNKIIQKDGSGTFHYTIDRLKQEHAIEFEFLNKPEINLINNRLTFWRKWYSYFDENKIDFTRFGDILQEFQSIVTDYYRICVSEPQTRISKIRKNSEIAIDGEIKEWRNAMLHYNAFAAEYNQFVLEVNGKFKETILSNLPYAQEL